MRQVTIEQEPDRTVLALIRGQERYIYVYDDESRSEALRVMGRHASNPDLSFSWYDAAVLAQNVRKQMSDEA